MSDYISRKAGIVALAHRECGNDEYDIAVHDCIETLKKIPAADVRPVRHGRWVTREVLVNPIDGIWRTLVECSECGGEAFKHEAYGYQRDNFCHLCGADMREDKQK